VRTSTGSLPPGAYRSLCLDELLEVRSLPQRVRDWVEGEAAKQYRVKPSYQKPAGVFLAIGPLFWCSRTTWRWVVVLFTHPGDAQWTEVVPVEHLEEAP